MRYLMLLMCTVLSLQLMGCASVSEVKAPCDYQGHFCGSKIRINQ
jgi:hypothetical protein